MSQGTLSTFFVIGIALTAPILWAALGELIIERSGVLNIGIEGVMILGALACAWAFLETGSVLLAVLAAVACGVVAGLILAILYVWMGADQIVTGILFSVVAIALSTAVADKALGSGIGDGASKVALPLLSQIPFLGKVLFTQDPLVYAAALAVPAVWYLMNRTWFGLYADAAGSRPRAVETAGVDVRRVRSFALLVGCGLTAVGGATLVLATSGGFSANMTAGRGFIALAVVVLARWSPLGAVLSALLFGMAQGLQFVASGLGPLAHVPTEIMLMLPYVLTIMAVVFAKGSHYPAACGVPYRPGAQ